MSKKFDIIERSLLDILKDLSIFTDQAFTMNVFNAEADAMPEFVKFRERKCNEKTQTIAGNNTKAAPHAMLVSELFNQQDETNIDDNVFIDDIATRIFSVLLKKLRDPQKTSARHLIVQDGNLS